MPKVTNPIKTILAVQERAYTASKKCGEAWTKARGVPAVEIVALRELVAHQQQLLEAVQEMLATLNSFEALPASVNFMVEEVRHADVAGDP